VLRVDDAGIASNADRHNSYSVCIARGTVNRLGAVVRGARLAAQMAGNKFEEICRAFLENTFLQLDHLRPGTWRIRRGSRTLMASHEQYAHLTALERAARHDPELATAPGSDYIVAPDIVITRETEDDATINARGILVDA
jgi:hypothetical protein